MTWSFKNLNAETCEEVMTASGFPTSQNVAINVASSSANQTAPSSFVEENMGSAVSSEDRTALIPFNHPKDCTKIATIPVVKTSETSVDTKLAVGNDFLPMHDSAHAGVLAFAPAEIRHLIYKFAMTADEGQFYFTDQTEPFTPNVATGFMRVNHAIYHEVRTYLYSQNTFVFTRCGSDLRIVLQPRDASRYGEAVSPARTKVPFLNKVVFDLGDNHSPEVGRFKTQCFMAALGGLRDEVKIHNLTLLLGHDCWVAEKGPHDFARILKNIKVTRSLEMLGVDTYLLHDVRAIPRALAMNIQPVWSKLYPCDVGLDSRGIFTSTYVPAQTPEEIGLRAGQVLMDAGVEYYARMMARNTTGE